MLSSNSMTISEMNLQVKDKDAIPDYRDIGDAGVSREEFSHDRNVWTAGFVALCIGIGSSTYL